MELFFTTILVRKEVPIIVNKMWIRPGFFGYSVGVACCHDKDHCRKFRFLYGLQCFRLMRYLIPITFTRKECKCMTSCSAYMRVFTSNGNNILFRISVGSGNRCYSFTMSTRNISSLSVRPKFSISAKTFLEIRWKLRTNFNYFLVELR